ncbi:ABC multidrug transporter Mdr2 [Taphrina deformans PYCC 5710]|uniref:ABC multidrug transporter Mdr2 n=1 Tax=Taphrina deformans (strain PYCC 5710 / ATCC 11124 / CBS 356.35 / IMI 108563 / JCM 9778 / NBRC 8474) TaxID=1097556 RepID=R4XG27_TAPDE|nr:ABC multidrug transporter Mdr2 [Taphrina deformans PYCC 5710]|eukprot:CCG82339.1 ABC multidrug transporter Mdr2 [Taphrina deformans PYCC 5710]
MIRCSFSRISSALPRASILSSIHRSQTSCIVQSRSFGLSRLVLEAKPLETPAEARLKQNELDFTPTDRAQAAAKVNLRAKLTSRDDENIKKVSTKDFFGLARGEGVPFTAALSLLLVSSGISMSIPFTIGKILDFATSTASNPEIFGLTMNQFYGTLGAVFVIGGVANFGRVLLLRVIGERVVAKLRTRLFRKTMAQDGEFFDANRHGDLISRLSSDTTIVGKSLTQNVSDGLRAVVSASAGIAMMSYVSVKLTGIMMLIVPPIALGAIFYGRYVRKLSRKTQEALGDLTKVSEERLGNVRTAQAFAGEQMEVRRYSERVREIFNLAKKEAIASGIFFGSSGLSGNLTILAILSIGGQMVTTNQITIGELSSFLLYTGYVGSSMVGMSGFYSELMKGLGAATRLFELLDREPSIKGTVGHPIHHAKGVIRFEDVTFAYPTRPAIKIFNGLSFSVQPGTNIAICGPSGGGKSTVSSLLLRYYDPMAGRITVDGVDIRDYNLKQLRKQISIVAQEPVLFSGTIAENIAYSDPSAPRSAILEAAKKANCSFVADFPEGLETAVGTRGTQLSGGQKQRIAIARALLKNPSILILDEATSALDGKSEIAVDGAIQRLMQQETLTTITIAHKLGTIRRADRIIVLGPNGSVVEQGTYRELSRQGTEFTKLMNFQVMATKSDAKKERPEVTAHGQDEEKSVEHEAKEEEKGASHENPFL